MSRCLKSLSDGIFILAESGVENQFYFYRSDRERLGDVGNAPAVLYRRYVEANVPEEQADEFLKARAIYNVLEDDTAIVITVFPLKNSSKEKSKKVNIFKRIFTKIFG